MLTTSRLLIRNYTCDDWKRVHLYASVPEFSQYQFWGPNTEAETVKFIADGIENASKIPRMQFDLAVCELKTNLLIGGVEIGRSATNEKTAFLGWAINPDFQSQGFATEAARALLAFGFSELGLEMVFATCDVRNLSSIRVMEKLGMKRVAISKGTRMIKGEIRDGFRYEIERSAFTSAN